MRLASIAVVLCVWSVIAICMESKLLPTPWEVLSNFSGSIWKDPIIQREGGGDNGYSAHCWATFGRLFFSLFFGCLAGLAIATLAWSRSPVSAITSACLDLLRSLPPLILIPFFLILSRTAEFGIMVATITYSTMNFAFYWKEAFAGVPQAFTDRARLCGIGPQALWRAVLLPSAVPTVLAGLRVSISLTLGVILVAEYIGSPDGIGRVLKYGVSYSSAVVILTCSMWAVVLSVFSEVMVGIASRYFLGKEFHCMISKMSDG